MKQISEASRLISISSSLVALALVAACATGKKKIERVERIQVGMDKAEVLETAGFGPRYSDRKQGQDRWIFEIYPDRHTSTTYNREVRFQEGKVVYVGDVQKPEVSAEEQDRVNAMNGKSDDVAIESALKKEGKKSVDLKEALSGSMPKQKFEEIQSTDETSSGSVSGSQ